MRLHAPKSEPESCLVLHAIAAHRVASWHALSAWTLHNAGRKAPSQLGRETRESRRATFRKQKDPLARHKETRSRRMEGGCNN